MLVGFFNAAHSTLFLDANSRSYYAPTASITKAMPSLARRRLNAMHAVPRTGSRRTGRSAEPVRLDVQSDDRLSEVP
jgi:hypothetical protein